MQGYCAFFLLWTILKRTSTEAHVYMRRHQGVSNVIYHKFSHGAVSYTINGENVNVMLEYKITRVLAEISAHGEISAQREQYPNSFKCTSIFSLFLCIKKDSQQTVW